MLGGSEKFCTECGQKVETSVLPSSPHVTSTEKPVESPKVVPEVAPPVKPSIEPSGAISKPTPTLKPGEVMVMCGKCGYEESASVKEEGWQCGECDANWYVIWCGTCGEPQVVPEKLGRTKCIYCQTMLTKSVGNSGQSTLSEVEPQSREFLGGIYRGGVSKNSSAPLTTRTVGTKPDLAPTPPRTSKPVLAPAPPRTNKRHGPGWRPLTWVILAMNCVFLAWTIFVIHAASTNCNGQTGPNAQACHAGTAIGAGVGVGIIIFLWVAVDVILGIIFLVTNRNQRGCPACGRRVKNGLSRCNSCGHAFA